MLAALRGAGHRPYLFSLEAPPPSADWDLIAQLAVKTSFVQGRHLPPSGWRSSIALFGLTPRHFSLTFSLDTLQQLQRLVETHRFDAAVAFELDAGMYVARLKAGRLVKILDACEPFMFWSPGGRLRKRGRSWKFRRFLDRMLDEYEAFSTVSDLEMAWVKRHLNPKRARGGIIPNGTDLEEPYQGPVDHTRVIYTGSLTYRANREAVEYFLGEMWSLVLRAVPQATFVVTGELPRDESLDGLRDVPGVTLAGLIDGYRRFVSSSGVLVVPLLTGGGTRVKILEALGLGCPVVATPKAVEGLSLVGGRDVLIAEDPRDLVEAVTAVMTDSGLRSNLVAHGYQAVLQYSWSESQSKFVALVESAASHRSPNLQ